MRDLILGIPTIRQLTYRAAEEYAANLSRYGHSDITILIADDAGPGANQVLVGGLGCVAADHPELSIAYLGPQEKACYLAHLEDQVEGASRLLGRGYGGNRNWLLLASFGRHLISVDDDVHPFGILGQKTFPPGGSVLQGSFLGLVDSARCPQVTFDILGAYRAMLGRSVAAVERDWAARNQDLAVGNHLQDSNADLALNTTIQPFHASTVEVVVEGQHPSGTIGIVQTFLSGDPDLDSKDLLAEYLRTGDCAILKGRCPYRFVVDRFRPCVLDHDYRITGAVLGLDNTGGTIPFIPTRFRLEDFLLRTYSRLEGAHVGYCSAVQTHLRSMVARNPVVADYVNEGLATLFKTMIQSGLRGTGRLEFQFDPRPDLRDEELLALRASLVEPLKQPEQYPGAWYNPSWNLYRALIREQALDLEDPGPFVAKKRKQLLDGYRDLLAAMGLWPRVLAFAERNPLRARTLHPVEAGQALKARAS